MYVQILKLSTQLVSNMSGNDIEVARTDHALVLILGLSSLLILQKRGFGASLLFSYASTGMWSHLGRATIRTGGLWAGGSSSEEELL